MECSSVLTLGIDLAPRGNVATQGYECQSINDIRALQSREPPGFRFRINIAAGTNDPENR